MWEVVCTKPIRMSLRPINFTNRYLSIQGSESASRQRRKRHTVAGIEQLNSAAAGASLEVPAVVSKMPPVDLTALAPEKQQAVTQVTEGWQEGTTSTTTAEPTGTAYIRDIVQRIHGIEIYWHVRSEAK